MSWIEIGTYDCQRSGYIQYGVSTVLPADSHWDFYNNITDKIVTFIWVQ